jgi:uncharacterized protein (TIGR03000 family)
MYSVLMLMAMTTAPETPNCGRGCYHSCYGGCYGYSHGCHGGWYGCYGGCHGYGGHHYQHGCHGCYGYYSSGVIVEPTVTTVTPTNGGYVAQQAAPATIQVTLPEGAKLFVDDRPTVSQGAVRVLATPPLKLNQEFTYTLTATMMQDQREVKIQKQVTVRANQSTQLTLEFPREVARK